MTRARCCCRDMAAVVALEPARNLIESVAERLAARLLSRDARLRAVRVRVDKPHVALPHNFDSVGVQILRWQQPAGSID